MTVRDDALAEIKRVIAENADLIGQDPELEVVELEDGYVAIVCAKPDHQPCNESKVYRSLDRALAAAREANRRAKLVSDLMRSGRTLDEALSLTPVDPTWAPS